VLIRRPNVLKAETEEGWATATLGVLAFVAILAILWLIL